MIGTDIVKIERIEKSLKTKGFLQRIFTEKEIAYYAEKGEKAQTLAGMFAAKEAVSKALGTGVNNFNFKDIEVCHNSLGCPHIVFYSNAAEIFKMTACKNAHISISHDGEYAVAFCVLK